MRINNKAAHVLKRDFPIFRSSPRLVYLDSAASTQKPREVVKFVNDFYSKGYANVHRGLYKLSEKSTELYSKARQIIADFLNASSEEIIFTSGTTDSINALAYSLKKILPKNRNEILLTEMEHHSNIVPWQQMAKRHKMKLKFVKMKNDFTLDMNDLKKKLTKKTAILSITHISNSIGAVNDIKEITELAHAKDVLVIVDAAQSVARTKIDVKNLGCDFLAFSGHKVFGPTGIGVLYGKRKLLEKLPPFKFGGEMIKTVTQKNSTWAKIPEKFEAGTPNIAGALGLGIAIKYIKKIGIENVEEWEKTLTLLALQKLKKIHGIEVYSPENSLGIIAFNLKGVHSHDVASMLDQNGVAIRAGHHCAMPLADSLGLKKKGGSCRISFSIYNTFEDVKKLAGSLGQINIKFKNRDEKN